MSTADRTRALRRRMIAEARRATVADGLQGFTIEQLCEIVGVSRRTFFNHFASKEDVVLGIELHADTELLAAYARGELVPAAIDPLGSVIALTIEQLHVVGLDRAHEVLIRGVFDREPALIGRFVSATDEQLAAVASAVRQRFGWTATDDSRARLVTEAAAGILRVSAAAWLDDDFDESAGAGIDDLIGTNLRQMQAAITSASTASTTARQGAIA